MDPSFYFFFVCVFICESRGGCQETRKGSVRGEKEAFREGLGRTKEHRAMRVVGTLEVEGHKDRAGGQRTVLRYIGMEMP